jgi:hypothetical protein
MTNSNTIVSGWPKTTRSSSLGTLTIFQVTQLPGELFTIIHCSSEVAEDLADLSGVFIYRQEYGRLRSK